jgi:hypothetical protein
MNKLKNLDIEVPEEFFKVVYLGEVENERHFWNSHFKYLKNNYELDRSSINDFNIFIKTLKDDGLRRRGYALGVKVENKSDETRLLFIAHAKSLSPIEKVYTEGHEETHGLDDYGYIDILENRLVDKGININLQGYNSEQRAVIGGLYTLALNKVTDNVTFKKLRDPSHRKRLLFLYFLGRIN